MSGCHGLLPLHAGASDIWRGLPKPVAGLIKKRMLTVEAGARTSLHCALAPELAVESGLYYDDCRPVFPAPAAMDRVAARQLWDASEHWLKAAAATSQKP